MIHTSWSEGQPIERILSPYARVESRQRGCGVLQRPNHERLQLVVVGVHYRGGGALQDRQCSKGGAMLPLEAFHVVGNMRRKLWGGGKEEHSSMFYWAYCRKAKGGRKHVSAWPCRPREGREITIEEDTGVFLRNK